MKKLLIITVAFLMSCAESAPHDKYDAQIEVEYYVESILKSPSTASFSGAEVDVLDSNTYFVEGAVDAENGFGGTVRSYYECEIEFTPDGKQRAVRKFKIR